MHELRVRRRDLIMDHLDRSAFSRFIRGKKLWITTWLAKSTYECEWKALVLNSCDIFGECWQVFWRHRDQIAVLHSLYYTMYFHRKRLSKSIQTRVARRIYLYSTVHLFWVLFKNEHFDHFINPNFFERRKPQKFCQKLSSWFGGEK